MERIWIRKPTHRRLKAAAKRSGSRMWILATRYIREGLDRDAVYHKARKAGR